jgi:hypothetical protein
VDEDGSWVIRGRLDPEVGALLQGALETAALALLEGDRAAMAGGSVPMAVAEGAPERPMGMPVAPPSIGQRRADALGLLIELALTNAGESTDRRRAVRRLSRVQTVLHVEADALRADSDSGQSVLAGGTHVSAETSRRLACDGRQVVMTHDRLGRVLDVGRSRRTIPVPIRRALDERDRGCRFPGCTNRITDAHHIQHWADGGATRLDNLLLLCPRHHRALHEGGYEVQQTAGGEFAFTDPSGGRLPVVPPLPARAPVSASPIPFDSANRVREVNSGFPHERLDLDWAMGLLWRSPSVRAQVVAAAV